MNLDVPLDDLIKSKSNRRSHVVTTIAKANTKSSSATQRRQSSNPGRNASNRNSLTSAATGGGGASVAGTTPKGGSAAKRANDPFSVPLDTLIASKSKQQQQQNRNYATTSAKQRASARLPAGKLRGRRYFAGTTSGPLRSTQGPSAESPRRVSAKVSVKRGAQRKLKSNYSKGLAAQVNRNRSIMAVPGGGGPGGSRNLSINRRANGSGSGRGGAVMNRQRRPQNNPSARWNNNQPGSRSIAFQTNRGPLSSGPRIGSTTATGTSASRSMISHAIGDTLPYNTGLGQGAPAIYRQSDLGPTNCHVAPPVYDKNVVTGSVASQVNESHDGGPSTVFTESDRSMFSKIKIMAQLDKISLTPGHAPPSQAALNHAQRHYSPQPATEMGGPRFRTLSDRFLS